jgi:hypothetical protein
MVRESTLGLMAGNMTVIMKMILKKAKAHIIGLMAESTKAIGLKENSMAKDSTQTKTVMSAKVHGSMENELIG